MATIIWTYIPREIESEIKSLAEELEERGHSFFIVNISDSQVLKKWTLDVFPPYDFLPYKPTNFDESLLEKWGARIREWGNFKGENPEDVLTCLQSYYEYMLDSLKPDVIVIWNPLTYIFGILGDCARNKGIKCFYAERSIVSPGFFVNEKGVLGDSPIKSVGRDFFLDSLYKKEGQAYLNEIGGSLFSLYKQDEKVEKKIKISKKKKILVLGAHEMQSGMYPPENADREKVLPFFRDNEEMINFLLKNVEDALVVFKPHPHSDKYFEEINDRFYLSRSNPNSLIEACDLVITNGSKLEVNVVASGKPLVLPGFGLLWNKGCAYEGDTRESFLALVKKCLIDNRESKEHYNALVNYLGFIIKNDFFLKNPLASMEKNKNEGSISIFTDSFLKRLGIAHYGDGKGDISAFLFMREHIFSKYIVVKSMREAVRLERPKLYRFLSLFSLRKNTLRVKVLLNKLLSSN